MYKIFLFLVCLGVVVVRGQQPQRSCQATGKICSSCDAVAVCIGTGAGFDRVLQACQPGENCIQGLCIPGALCNYRPFTCSAEGWFPDPYDCTKYHVCIRGPTGNNTALTYTCPVGKTYNALTGDCVANVTCQASPVPECLTSLQMGPVPQNPNLYYVCLVEGSTLAPQLRRCPAGRTFNAKTISCI